MQYSRRSFLQNSGAALAGAGLAAMVPGWASARPVAPSDKVRFALIGTNGMGWTDLNAHLGFPETELVALCDVDNNVLQRRAAEAEKKTGKKPRLYGDFRQVMDQKDIDLVIVATPDHWHPLIAISAMQAGKDVYCEKPLANSIEEIELMVKAARRYNRVVQVGQWQRSGPHWQSAMEFLNSGKLGQIRLVKAWAYQGWMKNVQAHPDEPTPAGVDYDMWLGPATKRPFNRNRFHFNFRWYWDYAGGLMTDWGVHIIDMVMMGMKVTGPKSVMAMGGKYAYPDAPTETPDTLQALYDYGNFTMLWEHAQAINGGPYGRDHGVAFIGNNGTLVADRSKWEVIVEVDGGKPKMEGLPTTFGGQTDLARHVRNFLDCIKTREKPNCDIETARLAALNAHLGNIAFKTGRRVYWDEANARFVNDPEAEKLSRAQYRDPWKLPVV